MVNFNRPPPKPSALTRIIRWFCVAVLATAPFPALGQEKDRLEERGALDGWEAVGRIDMPGGMCTGTLIAKDLVLTAAHCVTDHRGMMIAPQSIQFRAGYTNGSAIATKRVARIAVDPGYRQTKRSTISSAMMRNDIALLQLETAVSPAEVNPFVIFDGRLERDEVILVSYGQGRSESLTRESGCHVQHHYVGGLIGFDCDATFGSSGAPVFMHDNGAVRILSIVSGGGPDQSGRELSYGMTLPKKVAALKTRLRNTPRAPRISLGARQMSPSTQGPVNARFINRPIDPSL